MKAFTVIAIALFSFAAANPLSTPLKRDVVCDRQCQDSWEDLECGEGWYANTDEVSTREEGWEENQECALTV